MGRPKLDEKDKKQSITRSYHFDKEVVEFFKAKKTHPGVYLCGLVRADPDFQEYIKNRK